MQILLDLCVVLIAIPCSMLIMKTWKKDQITLLFIVLCSSLLFFDNLLVLNLTIFGSGLVLGYGTDLLGVFTNKWYYPHYERRQYSLSAGWGWGIVTLVVIRYSSLEIQNISLILPGFLVSWVLIEIFYGNTNVDQVWLVLRSLITILLIIISSDYLLLVLAAGLAIFIERIGTYMQIWIYTDQNSVSYIYLGLGYTQLCYLVNKGILYLFDHISPNMWELTLSLLLLIFYIFDYLNPEKKLANNKRIK